MLFVRSAVFNLLWYANIIVHMIVHLPLLPFLSREGVKNIARRWGRSSNFLHTLICGTKFDIQGIENVPETGCIIASKHQSIWEFYALWIELRDPSFVLKSELMKIPLFGWYVSRLKQIPIRRGDKGVAMRKMIKEAQSFVDNNREILIFPEGTRRAPGAEPNYRYGVTKMYLDLQCPVVPVALNAGLYWPRRKFLRRPGIIRVRYLEPIMPGLSAEDFAAELESRIETACDELYLLASEDEVAPPITAQVQAAIDRARARREMAS